MYILETYLITKGGLLLELEGGQIMVTFTEEPMEKHDLIDILMVQCLKPCVIQASPNNEENYRKWRPEEETWDVVPGYQVLLNDYFHGMWRVFMVTLHPRTLTANRFLVRNAMK